MCLIHHPSHSEGVCAECEWINHKGRMLRLPSQKLAPDEHEKQLYNGQTRLPAGELKQLDQGNVENHAEKEDGRRQWKLNENFHNSPLALFACPAAQHNNGNISANKNKWKNKMKMKTESEKIEKDQNHGTGVGIKICWFRHLSRNFSETSFCHRELSPRSIKTPQWKWKPYFHALSIPRSWHVFSHAGHHVFFLTSRSFIGCKTSGKSLYDNQQPRKFNECKK